MYFNVYYMAVAIIHSHELNYHAEPGREYLPRLIE